MRNSIFYRFALVVLLILLGSACVFTPQAALQAQNDATIAAMAAGTLDAIATDEAVNASPTAEPVTSPTPLSPTPLPPAATLVSTSTPFPTFTPQPTFTPLPTLTPIPLSTATSSIIPTGSPGSSGGGSGRVGRQLRRRRGVPLQLG